MGPPLPWLSRCYRLLPRALPTKGLGFSGNRLPPEDAHAGETHSTERRRQQEERQCGFPGDRRAELAQVEQLLEQQLELYQALLEGQDGAWEAQALVLKVQKLKEQMRRHREGPGERDAI
ncbi:mitochondrial coiled-coil domain protein 1 [Ornithorhynchus anatinus]|uniref:mitochondrial coiled-coil domain protein 1 n=1 Tax=Ornithorhynchus anatinus TaxID=9258 RepID=UPI0010A7BE99|nr:mitochondrial coiled-coil domain protein 1 [Ornithorhynchus anatinus]